MRAMVLRSARAPLEQVELAGPRPAAGQVLLRVGACGVCRTDLHVVDGELADPKLPLVPGPPDRRRAEDGAPARRARGSAGPAATAATAAADARTSAIARASPATTSTAATRSWPSPTSASASRCPDGYPDVQAAPLLCAGLIGYRRCGWPAMQTRLGLYGFGAAAHIVAQVARSPGPARVRRSRAGRRRRQAFARSLGAEWAGSVARRPRSSTRRSCSRPVGELVPAALRAVAKGGTVVCAGIHMTDIPSFPYGALGGALRALRREPHAPGRRGVPRDRAAEPVRTEDAVSARAGERGADDAAFGRRPRVARARAGGRRADR